MFRTYDVSRDWKVTGNEHWDRSIRSYHPTVARWFGKQKDWCYTSDRICVSHASFQTGIPWGELHLRFRDLLSRPSYSWDPRTYMLSNCSCWRRFPRWRAWWHESGWLCNDTLLCMLQGWLLGRKGSYALWMGMTYGLERDFEIKRDFGCTWRFSRHVEKLFYENSKVSARFTRCRWSPTEVTSRLGNTNLYTGINQYANYSFSTRTHGISITSLSTQSLRQEKHIDHSLERSVFRTRIQHSKLGLIWITSISLSWEPPVSLAVRSYTTASLSLLRLVLTWLYTCALLRDCPRRSRNRRQRPSSESWKASLILTLTSLRLLPLRRNFPQSQPLSVYLVRPCP